MSLIGYALLQFLVTTTMRITKNITYYCKYSCILFTLKKLLLIIYYGTNFFYIVTFEPSRFLVTKCGLHLNENAKQTARHNVTYIDIKICVLEGSRILFLRYKIAIMTFNVMHLLIYAQLN